MQQRWDRNCRRPQDLTSLRLPKNPYLKQSTILSEACNRTDDDQKQLRIVQYYHSPRLSEYQTSLRVDVGDAESWENLQYNWFTW